MKKMIFTDIDGTIRFPDGTVPSSTVKAIQLLQEAGCDVLICTGRPECEVPERILDIGFDGMITACGARVRYHSKVVYDREIPREPFEELMTYMTSHDIVAYVQQAEENAVLASQFDAYMAIDTRMHDRLPAGSERLCPVPAPAESLADIAHPEKMAFYGNTTPVKKFRAEMPEGFDVVPLGIPSPEKYTGEIMYHTLTKGNAIRALLEETGTSVEDTIAVGDSANDIPMLTAVGFSIVVGNGTPAAKAEADLVTDDMAEDGFYRAFVRLGLLP